MHISINIENNRIQASSVDLDGNTKVFKLGDGLNSKKMELSTTMAIRGINAYIGDIVSLIRHEIPNLKFTESHIYKINNPDNIYVDEVGRKWNGLYQLSLLIKKIKQDVQVNNMTPILSCDVCISPLMSHVGLSDLSSAFSLNELKLKSFYNYTSASALYLIHDKKLTEEPKKVIHFYADYQSIILDYSIVSSEQIRLQIKDRISLKSTQTIFSYFNQVIEDQFQLETGKELIRHASNNVIIEETVKEMFNVLYIKNEKTYQSHIVLQNEIIDINLQWDALDEINTEIKEQISSAFDNLIERYPGILEGVDYLLFIGKLGALPIFRGFMKEISEAWAKELVFSIRGNIIVKGLSLFNFGDYQHLEVIDEEKTKFFDRHYLRITKGRNQKKYLIAENQEEGEQVVTVFNEIENEVIEDLANEEVILEVINQKPEQEYVVGQIKLEPVNNYIVSQFQLSVKFKNQKIIGFTGIDILNDQIINIKFSNSKPIAVRPQSSEPKKSIKIIDKNSKVKILSNGSQSKSIKIKTKNKSQKIILNPKKELNKRLKIKIPDKQIVISDELTNASSFVEEFKEIIRIIVINNTP